jgi:hypothetical protein
VFPQLVFLLHNLIFGLLLVVNCAQVKRATNDATTTTTSKMTADRSVAHGYGNTWIYC